MVTVLQFNIIRNLYQALHLCRNESLESRRIVEYYRKFCENLTKAEKIKKFFPWGHNLSLLPLTLGHLSVGKVLVQLLNSAAQTAEHYDGGGFLRGRWLGFFIAESSVYIRLYFDSSAIIEEFKCWQVTNLNQTSCRKKDY